MHSVGEDGVGLLKFDFLGIRNLAILADAVENVKETTGTVIDIERIHVDDKKTFAMLARGETMGLFQLNGSGMTAFLKQLKPTSIHDINAMVALYRPGPMESIPQYIERKHNPVLVNYLDPRLEKILNRSYGVITYQDDVMTTAIELAGYSWLDADKLRKAMGKKIPEVMEAEKGKLLKGFVEYGKLPQEKAQALWKLIEPFAAYGFNKAHAASYGRVAYQTAYMKANFPVEYMTAVLTAESGDADTVAEIIHECERMNIPVLPPDINESRVGFAIIKDEHNTPTKIRFGLTAIKGFGEGLANTLVAERDAHEYFKSMEDFLKRISDKNINKKSMEALIMVGVFDQFGERGMLLANLENFLAYHRSEMTKRESSQDSLFGLFGDTVTHTFDGLSTTQHEPASTEQKLAWEKELLGVYIGGHPLDAFLPELKKRMPIGAILRGGKEGTAVTTAGMVDNIRPLTTQKGDKMAFVKLINRKDFIEMVAFPKTYAELQPLLEPGSIIAVKGKVSIRNDEKSIIIDAVRDLRKNDSFNSDQ